MHAWLSAQSENRGKVTVVCFQLRAHKCFLFFSRWPLLNSISAHLINKTSKAKRRNLRKKKRLVQLRPTRLYLVSGLCIFNVSRACTLCPPSPQRERSYRPGLSLHRRLTMIAKINKVRVKFQQPVNLAWQLDRSCFNPEMSLICPPPIRKLGESDFKCCWITQAQCFPYR